MVKHPASSCAMEERRPSGSYSEWLWLSVCTRYVDGKTETKAANPRVAQSTRLWPSPPRHASLPVTFWRGKCHAKCSGVWYETWVSASWCLPETWHWAKINRNRDMHLVSTIIRSKTPSGLMEHVLIYSMFHVRLCSFPYMPTFITHSRTARHPWRSYSSQISFASTFATSNKEDMLLSWITNSVFRPAWDNGSSVGTILLGLVK